MRKASEAKSGQVYAFGAKSKLLVWILNHPFYDICIIILAIGYPILFFEPSVEIRTNFIAIFPLVMLTFTVLMRIVARNFCYRVEIDTLHRKIKYYLIFNQGVVESSLSNVKIRLNYYFTMVVNRRKFIAHGKYLHDIVDLLPEDTEIKFRRLFWAFWKGQLGSRARRATKL